MSENKDIEDINKEIQLEPVSALSEEDINLVKDVEENKNLDLDLNIEEEKEEKEEK